MSYDYKRLWIKRYWKVGGIKPRVYEIWNIYNDIEKYYINYKIKL